MLRVKLEQAYPDVAFRPGTRNWWAWLTRVPPECVHLETQHGWMATLIPDVLYLRGKGSPCREILRPEVSLCRACLVRVLEAELAAFPGRVVAFEPGPEGFSQYFFLAEPDFEAAGLRPEVAAAIAARLARLNGACGECSRPASWLWMSQQDVASLDEVSRITEALGQRFCAAHGAEALCRALGATTEANLFYVNVPYGDAGAYVWI